MSIVFEDDFESYSVGDPVPPYPSTLGGLWSAWGPFSGNVSDDDSYLPGGQSLKFQTTGAARWQDSLFFYDKGTIKFAFKTSTAANSLFGLLDIFDADIPLSVGFPTPVFLFRLRWESDSTLSARLGHTLEFVNNSGYEHAANTPLGFITTEPFAADPDTWYICQLNVKFTQNISKIHVSFVVHINDKPVLVGDVDAQFSTTGNYPHGFPPTFNQLEFITSQNPFAYLDLVSFDNDDTVPSGGGATSDARVTQGVLEPIVLPPDEDMFARITQGVIEIDTEPDNYAGVTQAVIELFTTSGSGPIGGGWKVYEA